MNDGLQWGEGWYITADLFLCDTKGKMGGGGVHYPLPPSIQGRHFGIKLQCIQSAWIV